MPYSRLMQNWFAVSLAGCIALPGFFSFSVFQHERPSTARVVATLPAREAPPPVLEEDPWSELIEREDRYLLMDALSEKLGLNGSADHRPWKYIIFHHSATPNGNAKIFDEYHRQRFGDNNGVKYHFVVCNGKGGPDGEVQVTDRWKRQIGAAHIKHPANAPDSVAVCVVGNFEEQKPTPAQLRSLAALAAVLKEQFRIADDKISCHTMIDDHSTLCPGRHFPLADVKRSVDELLTR